MGRLLLISGGTWGCCGRKDNHASWIEILAPVKTFGLDLSSAEDSLQAMYQEPLGLCPRLQSMAVLKLYELPERGRKCNDVK